MPENYSERTNAVAEMLMHSLSRNGFAVWKLHGREFRLEVDDDSNANVYLNGDYEEALFDYGDLLDFVNEHLTKGE